MLVQYLIKSARKRKCPSGASYLGKFLWSVLKAFGKPILSKNEETPN